MFAHGLGRGWSGDCRAGCYVGKEVKRRIQGKSEIVEVMNSEEDRVKALGKYFDMHLRVGEIEGIRGLASELK